MQDIIYDFFLLVFIKKNYIFSELIHQIQMKIVV